MKPRTLDVDRAVSAAAHADAEPDDQAAAGRLCGSRRTAARWRDEGPPPLRHAMDYLRHTRDAWRIAAEFQAEAKRGALEQLTDAGLIERYHELLDTEPAVEAEDRRLDVARDVSWLDRSTASVRDAALNAEKAAIERLFAERGLTEQDVLGRPGRA